MNNLSFTRGDIRGIFQSSVISCESFYTIGRAVGVLARRLSSKVVIGRDTRSSGEILEESLVRGIIEQGVDCVLISTFPTAGVSYVTNKFGFDFGLVITASHNPSNYNGLKIFESSGLKINSKTIALLEELIENNSFVSSETHGLYECNNSYIDSYKNKCINSYNGGPLNKKIIIDCANGASSFIASDIFNSHFDSDIIFNDPDGSNINDNCGSTNLSNLIDLVLKNTNSIGIAFDGDSDRSIMISEEGEVVDGDEITFIIAKYFSDHGLLTNGVSVGTVLTNYGIRKSYSKSDIAFIEAEVGDPFVFEKMVDHGAVIGGEDSGHVIFDEFVGGGDGITTSIMILEIMSKENKTLSELKKSAGKSTCLKKNIIRIKNDDFKRKELFGLADKFNREHGFDGRVLIRESCTEPVYRILIESNDESKITSIYDELLSVY